MNIITSLIEYHHNPNLVDVNVAPNGNIQTLIFNDGEIIRTKGGSAFLQRSMFSMKSPINNLKAKFTLPNKLNQYTYAIVKDIETAKLIIDEMVKYNNSI